MDLHYTKINCPAAYYRVNIEVHSVQRKNLPGLEHATQRWCNTQERSHMHSFGTTTLCSDQRCLKISDCKIQNGRQTLI